MFYPRQVYVDLTTACNAKCVMCPTQLNPERKKLMNRDMFRRLVEEVADYPVRNEGFYIGIHGEVSLDRDLAEKIALCVRHGIDRTVISTNGALVNERRARELLAAGPWIMMFALESLSAARFETIRVGLSHSQVVNNIRNFINLRNSLGARTRVGIRFIEFDWNADERQGFSEFWTPLLDTEDRVDFIDFSPIHNWGYGDPTIFHGNTPCIHMQFATVLSDGTVTICCIDHEATHNLGNLADRSLLEIVNSPRAEHLRAVHMAGKRSTLPMCGTCDLAESWAGATPLEIPRTFVAAEHVLGAAHRD